MLFYLRDVGMIVSTVRVSYQHLNHGHTEGRLIPLRFRQTLSAH